MDQNASSNPPSFAYVAEGKLYVTRGETSSATLIDSTFVQEILDRAERNRDRNDWRQQGLAWNLTRGMPGLPGAAPPAEVRRVRFTGIASSGDSRYLYYALDTDYVGGLFEYDTREGYERRLYHAQRFCAEDLSRHTTSGELAMSLRESDGTAHIAITDANGRKLRNVTDGDVVDECPSWIAGENALVYQSAGVGRNEAGVRAGLSPYAIHKLDLDSGTITTLAESESHDFLLPRMSASGANGGATLTFIRRPYQPHGPAVSPWAVAKDVLLFPFRFVRSLVHFFDFFSRVFSKQPLITAGGPRREGPDQRTMLLWGRVIEVEKELRNPKSGAGRSLVPATWELVQRDSEGTDRVLASAVAAYDVTNDGRIIYTNGTRIFALDAMGHAHQIGDGKLIQRLRVLPDNP